MRRQGPRPRFAPIDAAGTLAHGPSTLMLNRPAVGLTLGPGPVARSLSGVTHGCQGPARSRAAMTRQSEPHPEPSSWPRGCPPIRHARLPGHAKKAGNNKAIGVARRAFGLGGAAAGKPAREPAGQAKSSLATTRQIAVARRAFALGTTARQPGARNCAAEARSRPATIREIAVARRAFGLGAAARQPGARTRAGQAKSSVATTRQIGVARRAFALGTAARQSGARNCAGEARSRPATIRKIGVARRAFGLGAAACQPDA
jgi:hypothetical protein